MGIGFAAIHKGVAAKETRRKLTSATMTGQERMSFHSSGVEAEPEPEPEPGEWPEAALPDRNTAEAEPAAAPAESVAPAESAESAESMEPDVFVPARKIAREPVRQGRALPDIEPEHRELTMAALEAKVLRDEKKVKAIEDSGKLRSVLSFSSFEVLGLKNMDAGNWVDDVKNPQFAMVIRFVLTFMPLINLWVLSEARSVHHGASRNRPNAERAERGACGGRRIRQAVKGQHEDDRP